MIHGMKEKCIEDMRKDVTGHTCMIWSRLEQNAIMEDAEDIFDLIT